jgi:hypothetical protein
MGKSPRRARSPPRVRTSRPPDVAQGLRSQTDNPNASSSVQERLARNASSASNQQVPSRGHPAARSGCAWGCSGEREAPTGQAVGIRRGDRVVRGAVAANVRLPPASGGHPAGRAGTARRLGRRFLARPQPGLGARPWYLNSLCFRSPRSCSAVGTSDRTGRQRESRRLQANWTDGGVHARQEARRRLAGTGGASQPSKTGADDHSHFHPSDFGHTFHESA